MSLNGNLKETNFTDILHFIGISRQTASLSIYLGDGTETADGVFWFDSGDLVSATMGGVDGRDAIRHALRLTSGSFKVGRGTPLPTTSAGARAALRQILMEETVNLDEENLSDAQGTRKAPTPLAASPATPSRPSPPRGGPPSPSGGASGGGGGRRSSRTLKFVLGAVVLVLAILGALATFRFTAAPPPPPPKAEPQPKAVEAVRGVTPAEIKLGMVADFTASNKERGRAMRVGWETAIAAANAEGGIDGRKIRLVSADDGYDPKRTGPTLKQMVEQEGVFAVVGNVGTATAAVSVPYVVEHKVILFAPLSGGDVVRRTPPDRYVFTYRASLADEGAAAVRYLVDVRRIPPDKIGVLLQKDDFGEAGWRACVKQLEAAGAKAANVQRMEYVRNTADVREALETLKANKDSIKAMVLVAIYKPAATFIRKARDAGLDLPFVVLSTDPSAIGQELVESGGNATQGVVLTQVTPVPTSRATGVARYRKSLEQFAPGEEPGGTSLEGWVAAQIFFEALKRTGPTLDTEKLVDTLESIEGLDLGTGAAMGFDRHRHQACTKVWGWELQRDGSYVQIDLD